MASRIRTVSLAAVYRSVNRESRSTLSGMPKS
jgi:hypothetical protein